MTPADESSSAAGGLASLGFGWQATRDGVLFVTWRGRTVRTLRGVEATRLRARLEKGDANSAQRALAGATRNFKRGNELRR